MASCMPFLNHAAYRLSWGKELSIQGMNSKESLQYALGALLYTPASHAHIAERLLCHDWPELTSVSLCLEDSIQANGLQAAEQQLKKTLHTLCEAKAEDLPAVFVRVRTPEHLAHVHRLIAEDEEALTGFIFPKFDVSNGKQYLETLREINQNRSRKLYCMPILESRQIASILTRKESLQAIRNMLDAYAELVLNVRVGGNDFSNLYGLRRKVNQTIYDLGVVRDILMDILNVFADAYVVSGPVWEYYGENPEDPWATGLKRELELDRANGLIGKTCIHPSQIPLINASMRVSREDYEDAKQILGWQDEALGVSGSHFGNRMNEVRCHGRWANMILRRAQAFGIEDQSDGKVHD